MERFTIKENEKILYDVRRALDQFGFKGKLVEDEFLLTFLLARNKTQQKQVDMSKV